MTFYISQEAADPCGYDRLPAIRLPTLVISGTADVVIPPANAVMPAERNPGARLGPFPGAGHGLVYRCPERFAGMVLEFLQGW